MRMRLRKGQRRSEGDYVMTKYDQAMLHQEKLERIRAEISKRKKENEE